MSAGAVNAAAPLTGEMETVRARVGVKRVEAARRCVLYTRHAASHACRRSYVVAVAQQRRRITIDQTGVYISPCLSSSAAALSRRYFAAYAAYREALQSRHRAPFAPMQGTAKQRLREGVKRY